MTLMGSLMIFICLLLMLFFSASKNYEFDKYSNSTFECGFTSYFFSRFSFSIHYYMIGLIFLFLDLELCYLMPFLMEDCSNMMFYFFLWIFVFVLILGLLEEWKENLLDWKF